MKRVLNTLKIGGMLVVAILVIASAALYVSGPQLPPDIDETIDEVLQSDVPELLKGNTGYVSPEHTPVWYESIGQNRSTRGAIVLFMGIAWEQSPYSLADLASDALLILDTLKREKAHLVGVSLGGMVAQEFAIHFPHRTLTLTCIMSSGHIVDEEIQGISMNSSRNWRSRH